MAELLAACRSTVKPHDNTGKERNVSNYKVQFVLVHSIYRGVALLRPALQGAMFDILLNPVPLEIYIEKKLISPVVQSAIKVFPKFFRLLK